MTLDAPLRLLADAHDLYRREGLLRTAWGTYNFSRNAVRRQYDRTVRPYYDDLLREALPTVTRTYDYNGVSVPVRTPILDPVVPSHSGEWQRDRPGYERHEAHMLARRCQSGSTVVVVGGGLGVTAVKAARIVGPEGRVVAYEASERSYEAMQSVVALNDVEDIVETRHAVVGEAISTEWPLGGDVDAAETISPADLPEADIYEMDCEGAELSILEEMTVRPDTIVVETHAAQGSPSDEVASILEEMGYRIVASVSSGSRSTVLDARRLE